MLFPWLKVDENQNIVFNRSWGDQNYKEDEKQFILILYYYDISELFLIK